MKRLLHSKRLFAMTGLALSTLFILGASEYHSTRDAATSEDTVMYVSGILAGITLEDMLEKADVIAIGEVVGNSDPFKVQSVGGGISVFTDYEIEPLHVVRGDFSEEQTLTIRTQGGQTEDWKVICEQEPELLAGTEYLFFLRKPNVGGGFNTNDDYYDIMGVNQGLFEAQGNGVYSSSHGESVDISALPSTIAEEIPDEDAYRQENLRNLKSNLDSGFISQEEYDRMVGELDQYATIIE